MKPARRAGVRALLPLCLLLLASAALAQEGTEEGKPEEPVVRLPEISVTGTARLPEALPRSWVPSSIDVIPGAEVGKTSPTELPDLLLRLPGVTLQNEQGSPRQPDLTLRGFTASPVTGLPQGVSVFLDGVRLNEPTAEEVNFDLIPLEDVDRVEVIRGASVLFGRNTLGGAVNLVTRRGQEITEITPEIASGSFGRQDYSLRMGGSVKPFDYYVSLSDSIEDGWRDFSSSRVSRLFGKLGLRQGGTDLTLSYQYSNDLIHQAGSLPESLLRVDRAANFTPGDFFAPELHLGIVNARQELGEHWTVEANAYVRSLRSEQFNVNEIPPNNRTFNDLLSTGGTLQATQRRAILGHDNVLIFGAEYTHHDVENRVFSEQAGAPRSLESDLADSQQAVGAYVQDSLTLLRDVPVKGSTVILTLAGRWDWLQHDIVDQLGGPAVGLATFQRANPRAGVNFNLSDRLGFYGSYSESFRAPAFLELTCASAVAPCPGLQAGVAPDPTLHPVVAKTYELGVTSRPLDWLDANVSGFWTDVEDDIFAVSPAINQTFFQNIGKTRRQGIELGLRGRAATRLDTYVNYTYTRATFQQRTTLFTPLTGTEVVRPGDFLSLVPEHRVNAGVVYHPRRWATLSADFGYVSEQFLRGDEVNRQRPLSDYAFVNLGASAVWRRLTAYVRLNNALDQEYETFGTFAPNARRPGSPIERFLTPALPINTIVGLQYVF